MLRLLFPSPRTVRDGLHPPRARSVVAVALLGLAGLAARADEADHERARAAVRAGEVLPLPTLLERLQGSYPGQVLELELERDDGRWIYEIKLLQPGGQVLKLEVDARTAAVLKQRRKGAPPPEGTAR